MSSFGAQLRKRLEELRKAGADVPRIIAQVNEGATIRAIETATENTPPSAASGISGVNTRTGMLKAHWQIDSISRPVWTGAACDTFLKNNAVSNGTHYASYVNDGHRMDRHFTTHVAIEGGQLVGKPAGDGGLMVGTKTTYVPGVFMKEKAIGKWRQVVRFELDKEVRARFKK